MIDSDIKKILKLRKYVIESHNSLDGAQSSSVAVIKQSQVAHTLTSIIKSLEDILTEHIRFEKK